MKLWDVAGDGGFWKVQLDVRDLGGHLGFSLGARAGTLSNRTHDVISGVASVGALPLGFQVKLGLVRGKYLGSVDVSHWEGQASRAWPSGFHPWSTFG